MKVEVIEKSLLGRELVFVVGKEKVATEKKKIVDEIKKDAVVEGFRKGKVPESIIEVKFADTIKENLLNRIIPELYYETIKEKNLNVVVEPSIYEVNLDQEGLKFKIYTEIKPEVVLKKYKGIPVKKRTPEVVTEEEIEKVLNEWEKKPEFSAAIIDPSKRRAWKDKIRGQMEGYNKYKASVQEEQELWEGVMKDVELQVPDKLIQERAARYTEDHFRSLDLKDKTEEERKKIVEEVFEKMKSVAELDIKKYFILDKISELEKIEVTPKDVDERIEKISRSIGEPVTSYKEKLEKAGRIPDIEDEIRIEKTFNFLKENSQSIEKIILPEDAKGR
jgi:FKBP-type peptidyl-prolyl cis-trans isomerase (trigger factor)